MYKLLLVVSFLALLAVGYTETTCDYVLTVNSSTLCAKVEAAISVMYSYKNDSNQMVSTTYDIVQCPSGNITVTQCLAPLSMKFDLDDNYQINFEFTQDSSSKWMMSNVSVIIPANEDTFPNSTIVENVEGRLTKSVFDKIDSGKSYMCNANSSFDMKTNETNVTMSMVFSELRVQAFKFDNNNEFGSARRCDNDVKGSKIVPIAVGAALAGLVIIVLIAYIIGRLRSRRQSSYEALS